MELYLDRTYYGGRYPDLRHLSGDGLAEHFRRRGIAEGRAGCAAAYRDDFLKLIPENGLILEIGPFDRPLLTGPHIRYFDVVDRAALVARCRTIARRNPDRIPAIHYVGDLMSISDTFSACLSKHVVEHQPDLIAHLQSVERLLCPGGAYFLAIPDKRFCFDHFIPESTIADILQAHFEKRTTHTLASVIEHRALTTHNDPKEHWAGRHGTARGVKGLRAALAEYDSKPGQYIDVHAWQFTPESFLQIIEQLHVLGFTRFIPVRVHNTPRNKSEFTAMLQRP